MDHNHRVARLCSKILLSFIFIDKVSCLPDLENRIKLKSCKDEFVIEYIIGSPWSVHDTIWNQKDE